MKRYLTYKDDKSYKFWQIEVTRESFTVAYGEIGTAGTWETKTFDSDEKCFREAEKLLNEKLKKGYNQEAALQEQEAKKVYIDYVSSKLSEESKEEQYVKDWKTLLIAKDKSAALIKHFSFLADSPGFDAVLHDIMEQVKGVRIENRNLIIHFSNDEVLTCSRPVKHGVSKLPQSFLDIITKHQQLSLETAMLVLGEHGGFNDNWLFDFESELVSIAIKNKIQSPLQDGSDFWLYHPTEINNQGQPVIYFLSHDGGDITNPQDWNAGSLFLKRIAETLELPIRIPVPLVPSKIVYLKEHKSGFERVAGLALNLYVSSKGHLLETAYERITIFKYESPNYKVLCTVNGNYNNSQRFKESNGILFRHGKNGVSKVEYDAQVITITTPIPITPFCNGVTIYENDIHYFDNEKKSFCRSSFEDSTLVEYHKENGFIVFKDSVVVNDILVYVGQRQMVGFKSQQKGVIEQVFQITCDFSKPKILAVPSYNYIMALETDNLGKPAVTIYEIGKTATKMNKLREKEDAIAWYVKGSDFWLLTRKGNKNGNHSFHFMHYNWEGNHYVIRKEHQLHFEHQRKYFLNIEVLDVQSDGAIFIDDEGSMWKLPLNLSLTK